MTFPLIRHCYEHKWCKVRVVKLNLLLSEGNADVKHNVLSQQIKEADSVKYEYELYVIIDHHGTYSGGHYDAHIKDESGNWYHFSDLTVRKVSFILYIVMSVSSVTFTIHPFCPILSYIITAMFWFTSYPYIYAAFWGMWGTFLNLFTAKFMHAHEILQIK